MQAPAMPMKTDPHTWGYYREGGHKILFSLWYRFVEMKADGLGGFLFCFFPAMFKGL